MEYFQIALLILACTALLTGGFAFCPPDRAGARLANRIGPGGAALGCLAGLCALLDGPWLGTLSATLPWGLPFGRGILVLDPLARLFLLPIFGLGMVCAFSGGFSLSGTSPREHNLGAHWFFYVLLLLGMAVVTAAGDIILFLVAWEIMSLAPFFLIDFNDGDSKVRDASWVYLVAAHLGAVFLIAFFALLWQHSGETSLALLSAGGPMEHASLLFILALLGFGAKAGIAPLHVWLPEAHPAAPSHVSALLSGAMINTGLYGILRAIGILDGAPPPAWWGWGLLFLGLGTGLAGILKALAQSNLKRMLAYSSVENMGVMLMGVGAGLVGIHYANPWIAVLGFAGALFHMLNHAAFKGLLFLCAGEVLHATGTVRMEQLGGLQKRLPLVGAFFALGACAIACLPPLNGFFGEFVLALSFLGAPALPGAEARLGLFLPLAGLALISGLAAVAFAKAYGISFLGEPRTGFAANARSAPFSRLWPLLLPAIFCVAAGAAAPPLFRLIGRTALAAFPALPGPDAAVRIIEGQIPSSLASIALMGAAGVCLVLGLLLLRGFLIRRKRRMAETWGCGYAFGTPRIQYTGGSFSEPLAKIFGALMGLKTRTQMDDGYFPGRSTFAVFAVARLRTGLFRPAFEAVESFCNMLKIIQHGKIHLYILYILATVTALLVWGLAHV